MKIRLYEENEKDFATNGVCNLDAVSCIVREQLNGWYEAKLTLKSGHKDIKPNMIIVAKPNEFDPAQPFSLYSYKENLKNNTVTYLAEHITYRTGKIIVPPFKVPNIMAAVATMQSTAVNNDGYTITTDIDAPGDVTLNKPSSIRNMITTSIVPQYKAELKYNGRETQILAHRGADRGFSVVYGKNLADYNKGVDISDVYDGIYPFYCEKSEEGIIYRELREKYILTGTKKDRIYPLDLTAEYDEVPSEDMLRKAAKNWLATHNIGAEAITIKVNFEMLSQTEEYKDIAPLEKVELGDDVIVKIPNKNLNIRLRCVETEYDAVSEKYISITLGVLESDVSESLVNLEDSVLEIQEEMYGNKSSFASIKKTVGNHSAQIESITNVVGDANSGLVASVASVTQTANETKSSVEALAQKVTVNTNTIADVKATADGASSSVEIVSATATANVDKIAKLQGDFDTQAENVASISTETNKNSAKISLVVSSDASGDKVNGSAIIEAVNGESVAKISADRVELSGDVIVKGSDISELNNNSGFQTSSEVETAITGKGYQTSSEVETAITGKGYQTLQEVNDNIDMRNYQDETGVVSIIDGTVTADYLYALGVVADNLISKDASSNNVVSIQDGYCEMNQFVAGGNFTSYVSAPFYQSTSSIANSTFSCGFSIYNVKKGYASVGLETGASISFQKNNGEFYGSWTMPAAAATTSDRSKKHDIMPMDEKHKKLFDLIRPVTYKYNDGQSGRTHTGFIADEVEQAVLDAGLTTKDFAGYVKAETFDRKTGETAETKCLRYEEFIAILWAEVQNLKRQLKEKGVING